jgi:hypothetical protein
MTGVDCRLGSALLANDLYASERAREPAHKCGAATVAVGAASPIPYHIHSISELIICAKLVICGHQIKLDFQRCTHDRRVRDDLDKSQYRVSGNIKVRTRVWLAEALIRAGNCMETSMTRFTFLGVAAFLSTAIATPVLAQAVIQEPGAYAFHYPNGDSGIGSTLSQRREAVVAGGGAAGASVPSVHSSRAGRETATRPWSAPVGHRQPTAADVLPSTSTSQQILDQEDASVDRKIRNVCRGC